MTPGEVRLLQVMYLDRGALVSHIRPAKKWGRAEKKPTANSPRHKSRSKHRQAGKDQSPQQIPNCFAFTAQSAETE